MSHHWAKVSVLLHGVFERSGGQRGVVQIRLVVGSDEPAKHKQTKQNKLVLDVTFSWLATHSGDCSNQLDQINTFTYTELGRWSSSILRVRMEDNLHRVLFLRQRGLVTLQRGGHDRLLAADRGGGEGRVLQVQGVLLGPHV